MRDKNAKVGPFNCVEVGAGAGDDDDDDEAFPVTVPVDINNTIYNKYKLNTMCLI
jgi:hypothetical protein